MIIYILSILLLLLCGAMFFPMVIDYIDGNENYIAFAESMALCFFIGFSLYIISNNKKKDNDFSFKKVFILTNLAWVLLIFFNAIPYYLSNLDLHFVDAFFESTSGLTATGATIITDLEQLSRGLLLWRAISCLFGGIGIIVMIMAIMPVLKIGSMHLFRTESSDHGDKILSKARDVAISIFIVYMILYFLCVISYYLAGMSIFDAICHAMASVATAGVANYNDSFAHFNSYSIWTIATIFMCLGALPLAVYIKIFTNNEFNIFKDKQIKGFIKMLTILIITMASYLIINNQYDIGHAFSVAGFNVMSIVTTTGYSSEDYSQWGNFAVVFFFFIGAIGGCTGSTTGGVKIFRFQIVWEVLKTYMKSITKPHGIFKVSYQNRIVTENVIHNVISFIFLFLISFIVVTVIFALTGLDIVTSLSSSMAMITNVGPALGDISGPAGNYSTFPDPAKWVACFAMLIGRLEFFTVIILFSVYFWRK